MAAIIRAVTHPGLSGPTWTWFGLGPWSLDRNYYRTIESLANIVVRQTRAQAWMNAFSFIWLRVMSIIPFNGFGIKNGIPKTVGKYIHDMNLWRITWAEVRDSWNLWTDRKYFPSTNVLLVEYIKDKSITKTSCFVACTKNLFPSFSTEKRKYRLLRGDLYIPIKIQQTSNKIMID